MGKRELVALLCLSSWCLAIVVWLFLAVPWVCQQFVIVVFSDHTHLLFFMGYLKTGGREGGASPPLWIRHEVQVLLAYDLPYQGHQYVE